MEMKFYKLLVIPITNKHFRLVTKYEIENLAIA